ncbi:MAG: hypothetical protein SO001_07330 [Alloprevotella sp.]|nr:hypothetical protein [Alloprevotella sp.]
MSDGNFNRNLLPYRDFQSGVRAGRAQMRTAAVAAFEKWLDGCGSAFSEEERAEAMWQFKDNLIP